MTKVVSIEAAFFCYKKFKIIIKKSLSFNSFLSD